MLIGHRMVYLHLSKTARTMPQYLLAMTIFGTIGLFVRLIDLPSEIIALARGCIGSIFLFLVLTFLRRPIDWPAIRRNLPILLISGAALGFNWIFLFEAFRLTSIAAATLSYYMAPVILIVLSPFILKEKVSPAKLLCAAVALFGMSLASGIWTGDTAGVSGIVMGLVAACFYASLVFANKFLKPIGPYESSFLQLGISALVLLPYVALTADVSTIHPTLEDVLLTLFVAVVHTGVAYRLYFAELPKLEAARIAIFAYLDPAIAILLSVFVLGEDMTMTGIVGAVLILGASLASELIGLRTTTNRS